VVFAQLFQFAEIQARVLGMQNRGVTQQKKNYGQYLLHAVQCCLNYASYLFSMLPSTFSRRNARIGHLNDEKPV